MSKTKFNQTIVTSINLSFPRAGDDVSSQWNANGICIVRCVHLPKVIFYNVNARPSCLSCALSLVVNQPTNVFSSTPTHPPLQIGQWRLSFRPCTSHLGPHRRSHNPWRNDQRPRPQEDKYDHASRCSLLIGCRFPPYTIHRLATSELAPRKDIWESCSLSHLHHQVGCLEVAQIKLIFQLLPCIIITFPGAVTSPQAQKVCDIASQTHWHIDQND